MKIYRFAALALVLALCILTIPAAAEGAASGTVPSEAIPDDTPVTYGYLKAFREQIKREIIAELTESGESETSGGYREISVKRGEALVPAPGCEIIFRGGSAVAVSSSGEPGDGIFDVSEGAEIFSGEALRFGHIYYGGESEAEKAILIVGGTGYFTVRGGYEIR